MFQTRQTPPPDWATWQWRNDRWYTRDRRWEEVQRLEGPTEPAFGPEEIRSPADYRLVDPTRRRDHLYGQLYVRVDGGSIERRGRARIYDRGEGWGPLRTVEGTPYDWVRNAVAGEYVAFAIWKHTWSVAAIYESPMGLFFEFWRNPHDWPSKG